MRTLALFLMVIVGSSFAAPLRAQSLAEVAKKEEDRRKGKKSAPKTYTNNDLKPVPLGTPPAGAPDASGQSASTTADAADTAAPAAAPTEVKDRAYWSKRMQAARAKLETDRLLADALQSRINALTMDFINRDDPAQRGKVATEREKALAELDRMKVAIAADEKAVPDIEEEARRSGAPPGWLR